MYTKDKEADYLFIKLNRYKSYEMHNVVSIEHECTVVCGGNVTCGVILVFTINWHLQ